MRPEIREEARGRWRGLLPLCGIDARFLEHKQGPCPMCGGKDRFRFDDREGEGTWFCNACRAGDGVRLVELFNGLDFRQAVSMIRKHLPGSEVQKAKKRRTPQERLEDMRALWRASNPLTRDNEAGRYLAGRGLVGITSVVLRSHPKLRFDENRHFPGMIALVHGPDGSPVSLHRTFLQNGRKADVDKPRRMMAGVTPAALTIRLHEAAEVMGVAEGIETALSASRRFGFPCWSAVSADSLRLFDPPSVVKRLVVFGDNDTKYVGQAAAYALAARLACKRDPIEVSVEIPPVMGTDWADEVAA